MLIFRKLKKKCQADTSLELRFKKKLTEELKASLIEMLITNKF